MSKINPGTPKDKRTTLESKALKWVQEANARLTHTKVRLKLVGLTIYLRATLPAKPWEENQKTRQRNVSIGIRVGDLQDVRDAEDAALELDLDLRKKTFDWLKFPGIEDPREAQPQTVGDWVRLFEELKKKDVEPLTWERNYAVVMRSLPVDKELTESVLIDWILRENPTGNTMRAKYITIALGLCEVAKVPPGNIPKLRRDVPSRSVNVRELPDPEEIEATFFSIRDSQGEWRWVFGMLATYGLRPHEIFRLEMPDFPDIHVTENSKTGARDVTPVRPDWVKLFGLVPVTSVADLASRIPSNLEWSFDMPNTKLGRKISDGFARHGWRDAYVYRHCFARDCLALGLSSDIAAKLMGHSREVHEDTYRRHIKSSVYLNAAKEALRNNR